MTNESDPPDHTEKTGQRNRIPERRPAYDDSVDTDAGRFSDDRDDADHNIGRRDILKLLGITPFAGGALATVPSVALAQTTPDQKLVGDSDVSGFFGSDVAVADSGDLALVGAPFEPAAYVFEKDGGSWQQIQRLAVGSGEFGAPVAIESDTFLIADTKDAEKAAGAGAVYVFESTGDTWTQSQKLFANDSDQGDGFGTSISVDGDTAFVGARFDDENGEFAGAVYVFEQSGGTWSQTRKLTPSDASAKARFGSSVAFTGSTAVIGAYKDPEEGEFAGAIYVFEKVAGTWTEQQKLTPSDAKADELFGGAVGLSPDEQTAIAGTILDSEHGTNAGAAYVFERSGGNWSEQQKLTPTGLDADDRFGSSVAFFKDTALIGAFGDSEAAFEAGAAYLFEQAGGTWSQSERLVASDPDSQANFGISAASGSTMGFVGADGLTVGNQGSVGAAYVFEDIGTVTPILQVRNVRPVQVVEGSVLRNPGGNNTQVTPEIPDLVAGKSTSILFSLGASGLGSLSSGDTVEFVVRREYSNSSVNAETFTLEKSELQTLADPNTDEAEFFDATVQRRDKLPIFEPNENLESISVGIDPDIDGDGTAELETTDGTVSIGSSSNIDITSMDTLRVGYGEVQDPETGDNYGDDQGFIKDNSTILETLLSTYLRQTYPVDSVVDYGSTLVDDDVSLETSPGGDEAVVLDMMNVRAAILREHPDVDFDVTVAFVPEDYLTFHNKSGNILGIHYGNVRASAVVRGDLRVDRSEDSFKSTGAHEVGHHFLGEAYPDNLAMRRDRDNDGNVDEIDNAHARTPSALDRPVLESTGFDLTGRYELVGTGLDSFMSYSGFLPTWADTHAYQTMLDDELEPHSSAAGPTQRVVEGLGSLESDGSATFPRVLKFDDRTPIPSVQGGTVTLSVLDASGAVLDERTVDDHIEVLTQAADPANSRYTVEDLFAFVLPFPEDAAEMHVEHDGTVTRLNPIERSLRDAIEFLPDRAFKRSPDDRRAALNDKLDSLDEMMAKDNYHPATKKLKKDIRDKLVKWLKDDYETSSLQPTKQELLELVDEMVAQLERLAKSSSNGEKGKP